MTPGICLALAIYFEARSEPVQGQIAVGQVILRRVESPRYPNTICGVVWQPHQFSWTSDGKSDKPSDKSAYATSRHVARYLLKYADKLHDFSEGSTHYFNPKLADPYWARSGRQTAKIGNHVFLTLTRGSRERNI